MEGSGKKHSISKALLRLIYRVFIFVVIFSTVFSPIVDIFIPYLPEEIAYNLQTKSASAAINTDVYVFITYASATAGVGNWTVPSDWNPASNSIEVIGAGGGGADGSATVGAQGGGGGGYSIVRNLVFAATSTSIPFAVGASGSGGSGGTAGGDGGHTFFGKTSLGLCASAGPTVCAGAEGGEGGTITASLASPSGGGTGAASASGNTKYAGGNGGGGSTSSADGNTGGGGAGGPRGAGKHSAWVTGTTNIGGSGGGGAGGGSSSKGNKNSTGTGGAGGHGYGGSGGGTGGSGNGGAGSQPGAGGGGGGITTTGHGGDGAAGQEWTNGTFPRGSGGGGGGSADLASMTGGNGGYAGGGGGAGQACTATACAGEDGIIVIKYRPLAAQTHTRWYNDDGAPGSATAAAAEDTKPTLNLDTNYRLRLQIANIKNYAGTAFSTHKFRLEMTRAGSSCTNGNISAGWQWRTVPITPTVASDAFDIEATSHFADGASVSSSTLTAPTGAATFTNGYALESRATSGYQTINDNAYTEFEWSLKPNSTYANVNATYCFRAGWIIDDGTTPDTRSSMSWSKIASASVQAAASPVVVTQRAYIFQNDDAVNGNPNSNTNTTSAVNTALTNVKIGQRFVARFQVDTDQTVSGANFKIQYDKGSDANWRDLGVASAAFYPAPVMSFNNVATRSLTASQTGSCNGGDTYANGEIISNSIFANTIPINSANCTDLAFAIRTASVSANTTYRFRLLEWTASASQVYSQYPTVTTVTSANDVLRYSKFLAGPPVTASQSLGFMAASRSYAFSIPLDQLGYSSVSTDNSKFDLLASISSYAGATSVASTSNLFFQDGAGLYKIASAAIGSIGWNGTYWAVGQYNAKLIRISQNRDGSSYANVSANLSNWASTEEIYSVEWNGTYWLIAGGGTAAELNRCNFDLTSCTDVSGNLSGFGGDRIWEVEWNGSSWLITGGGNTSPELNRCNFNVTSCTSVFANLTNTDANWVFSLGWNGVNWVVGMDNKKLNLCNSAVSATCTDISGNLVGWDATDAVGSILWNGTYWLISGGDESGTVEVNRCNATVTSCVDVTSYLVNFSTDVIDFNAIGWNGTYWLIGASDSKLNMCNADVTSCRDVSKSLVNYPPGTTALDSSIIKWSGTHWLIGQEETGRLNRCNFDLTACEDLHEGLNNWNSSNVQTVSGGSNFRISRWLIGGVSAKANRCLEDMASCSFVTLSNFSTDGASTSHFANGEFAIAGGITTSRLNSCPLQGGCTDRSSNLTATTNGLNAVHGGSFWLVGGNNKFLNRCPIGWGACTSVAANLSAGWAATDSVKAILWTGSRWFIGGGTSDDLNVCTGSDVTSCTAVTLSGFAVQVRALAKNSAYVLVGGAAAELNRCTLAGASCTDVSAKLSGFGSNAINSIQWNGSLWVIVGAGGKINICNEDVGDCRDVSSNTSSSIGANKINSVGWSGKLFLIGADSAKVARIYPRFPVYHIASKNGNGNNTDRINFTWNGKTSLGTASSSFNLEAFNFSTNKWVPASVSFSKLANTEFSVRATVSSTAPPGWWNSSWGSRKKIYINNSFLTENLYNFPVLASFSSTNIDYAKTMANGEDIRFVDEDGAQLAHEIEGSWNESGTSLVWVKVPKIPPRGTPKYIWVYYNNSGASDGQAATSVWDSGYKGVWHLSNLNDSTSGGRNLTNSNAASTTGGKIGSAYDFERDSSAYAYVASLPTNATDNWTIQAWIKPETSSLTGNVVINGAEPTGGIGIIQGDNSCTAGTEITPVFNGVACIDSDVNYTGAGSWDHVVITRTGGIEHIYKNGSNSSFADAAVTPNTPSTNFSLGIPLNTSQVPQGTNYHDGVIDEVRVSDTPRGGEWIKAEFSYMASHSQNISYMAEENLTDHALSNYYSQSFGGSSYWTHWRFYQRAGFETLSTDFASVSFTAVAGATTYTQNDYIWYENANGAPVTSFSGENSQGIIYTKSNPVRLRMNLTVGTSNLSAGAQAFKLQYAGNTAGPWFDLGETTDLNNTWRFYNNAASTSGDDVSIPLLLAASDVRGTYQESNSSVLNPYSATTTQDVEYDFAIDPAKASLGSIYYFRMIKSDGTALTSYTTYPELNLNYGSSNTNPPSSGGDSGGGTAQTGGGQGYGGSASSSGGSSGGGNNQSGGGQGGGGGGESPIFFEIWWLLPWWYSFIGLWVKPRSKYQGSWTKGQDAASNL